MKKDNVIDFTLHQESLAPLTNPSFSISEELEIAIQNLIFRLRELGPIK